MTSNVYSNQNDKNLSKSSDMKLNQQININQNLHSNILINQQSHIVSSNVGQGDYRPNFPNQPKSQNNFLLNSYSQHLPQHQLQQQSQHQLQQQSQQQFQQQSQQQSQYQPQQQSQQQQQPQYPPQQQSQHQPQSIGFNGPIPRRVIPQIYTPVPGMSPYVFPSTFYQSGMLVPNINYRPPAPFQVRNMGIRSNLNSNESTRIANSFQNKGNDALNQEFLDIFKKVEKPTRVSVTGEDSDKLKSKINESSPTSRKNSISSISAVSVNGTSYNSPRKIDTEANSLFTKLFQDIPKPIHNLEKENNKVQSLKVDKINLKSNENITDSKTDKDVCAEFTKFIKNVVHAEPAPVVTCEYGMEIDGMKTYTIDEMLQIKSKMTYDIQKMVQTLSKFRIAIKSQLSVTKSENAWRSQSEMKELGILSDKIVFERSMLKILNKITALNFYQNCDVYKLIKFSNEEEVKHLALLVYEKASIERAWSFVYAEFVMFILNRFKTEYEKEGYEKIFIICLDELLSKGLVRNMEIEQEIVSMKQIKSTNIDEIDKIIGETAEKETKYRKQQFGVLFFFIQLYYTGYIIQSRLDDVLKLLKAYEDSLGIELYSFFLTNIAKKFMLDLELKSQLFKRIDELDQFISKNKLAVTAKFAVMDLVKHKSENFKLLPPRKTIPSLKEIKSSQNALNQENDNLSNINIKSGSSFGQSSRLKNKFKMNTDIRRPDLSALNRNVRGKSFQRGARGGAVGRELLNIERFNSIQDVNLDKEDITTDLSLTKGLKNEKKPISIQKRSTTDIPTSSDVFSNTDNEKLDINKRQLNHKYFSVDDSDKIVNKLENMEIDSPRNSVDLITNKNDEISNLIENAQTLISSFHKKDANVSTFMIELLSHKLSDNMEVFLKEAFKYFAYVSDGHYTWGVLLSEIMQRFKDLIPCVINLIKSQLDELSLNAIDEPVLWDYFFVFIYPILLSNSFTFDDLYDILSQIDEIYNADQIIIKLLQFSEKQFALYDNALLVTKQIDTKFWKRIENNNDIVIENIKIKMNILTNYHGTPYNWVSIFLDLNFDNKYVFECLNAFYNDYELALKDLALSIYLNSNIGDKFTNDLIPIFDKRTPEFMNSLFGECSSQKLLKMIADVFIKFQYIPHGVIIDVGISLFKTKHVDRDWLASWKAEDKPGNVKIDSYIYKIIKSSSL